MRINCTLVSFVASALVLPLGAAPTIDPIPTANIPAGKSLIVPVTASSPNGRPLTFTAVSSTNRITVEVRLTHDTGQPCDRVPAYADLGTLTGVRRTAFLISTRKVADLVLLTIHEVTPMSDAGPVG